MTGRLSVLVVEPEPMARRLTLRLLERLGHTVETVAGGPEAMAAAGRGGHDLVLVTCDADGLDPSTVAGTLRMQGRHTWVVAVAEGVTPADEQAWRQAGVADWLAKPVRPDTLARLLDGLGEPAPLPLPPAPAGLAVKEMLETRFRDAAPFYAEMLAVFAETSREPLARMRAALAGGAGADVRTAAHFVKGGALAVGAESAAAEARALEAWGRTHEAGGVGDEADAAARLGALERALDEIQSFAERLSAWARRGGAGA